MTVPRPSWRRRILPVVAAALTVTGCAVPLFQTGERSNADDEAAAVVLTAHQWAYAQSLSVAVPADLPHPVEAPCAHRVLPPDWVRVENALPGDASWRPVHLSPTPKVPIYVDQPSTTCGTPVTVHLGGAATTGVTVRAYRVGWYGGAGARLVWTSAPVDVPASPGPSRQGDAMPSPAWPTTVRLPVGPSWTPGQYLVESWDASGVSGVTGLVVRDDTARPGGVVVLHSLLTWTAYSRFGSSSLYKGEDGTAESRALQVAIARPITNTGLERLVLDDVPITQFLEEHGYAARHLVDTDLDAWPSLVQRATLLVLPGHSEYWTARMYDAAVAARNAGVNIADFGANEVYWQARVTRDAAGVPVSMFVARTLSRDPLAASDPAHATVEWRSNPLYRDSAALLGQSYTAVKAHGGLEVWSLPAWLGAGTGLHVGQVLRDVVQNESDGFRPRSPATPTDLQTVLVGALRDPGHATVTDSTTYYTAASGAAVFAAGTTFWTCDLTGSCAVLPSVPTLDVVRRLTENVLRAFTHPRWGRSAPSLRAVPPDVPGLLHVLAPGAVGSYGR